MMVCHRLGPAGAAACVAPWSGPSWSRSRFEVASVLAGGSYWNHYLIQLVVAVGGARRCRGRRGAMSAPGRDRRVGRRRRRRLDGGVPVADLVAAVERRARRSGPCRHPGDTIVTVYGHSDVDFRRRACPRRTPTCGACRRRRSTRSCASSRTCSAVRRRRPGSSPGRTSSHVGCRQQHRVPVARRRATTGSADLHGHTIYLRNGVDRSAPTLRGPVPRTPPELTTAIKEHLP